MTEYHGGPITYPPGVKAETRKGAEVQNLRRQGTMWRGFLPSKGCDFLWLPDGRVSACGATDDDLMLPVERNRSGEGTMSPHPFSLGANENRTAEGIASGQDDGLNAIDRHAVRRPLYPFYASDPNAARLGRNEELARLAGMPAPMDLRLDILHAQVGDLFLQLHHTRQLAEQIDKRVDMLVARAQKLEIAFEAQAKRIENMEAWTEGSAKIERDMIKRIGKLETSAVCDPIISDDFQKRTTTRFDAMLAQIDRQGERLEKLEDQMPAALGLTPNERPATPVESATAARSPAVNHRHLGD